MNNLNNNNNINSTIELINCDGPNCNEKMKIIQMTIYYKDHRKNKNFHSINCYKNYIDYVKLNTNLLKKSL